MSPPSRHASGIVEARLAMAMAEEIIAHGRAHGHDAAFLLIVAEHLVSRVVIDMIPAGARDVIQERVAANIAEIVAEADDPAGRRRSS